MSPLSCNVGANVYLDVSKWILIKVLCEQTREANKRIKMFFGLCLILFGFGNIVADFHVLFRVLGN